MSANNKGALHCELINKWCIYGDKCNRTYCKLEKTKVYTCEKCGQAIYYGEHYALIDGQYRCKECVKNENINKNKRFNA